MRVNDFPNIPTLAIRKWPRNAIFLRCEEIKDQFGKDHRSTVLIFTDHYPNGNHLVRTASFSIEEGHEGEYLGEA